MTPEWSVEPAFEVMQMTVFEKSTVRPLGVVDLAFVQDLEQDVHDIRVGFLDLIKQHDAVRVAADLLGQLAGLVVTDIARGEPIRRETAYFSIYSLISIEISGSTVSKSCWPAA